MDINTVLKPTSRGFFLLVVLLSASLGSALAGEGGEGKGKNELQGVWQLESGTYTTASETIERTASDFQSIKVITGSYWVCLQQEPMRAKFVEGGSDAEVLAAASSFHGGGGRYTAEDGTYTEHIEFFQNPNWVGQSIQFKYEMQGPDKWIQSGTFPLKEMGLAEYDTESVEVWKRIE